MENCANCKHHDVFWSGGGCNLLNGGERCKYEPNDETVIRELREKLSRYEKAEREGRLVELPCKIGTPAFLRYMDCERPYKQENCSDHTGGCDKCNHRVPTAVPIEFNYQDIPRFGKTVFLTREEAEAALKEREG